MRVETGCWSVGTVLGVAGPSVDFKAVICGIVEAFGKNF